MAGGFRLVVGVDRALAERGAKADDMCGRDRDRRARLRAVPGERDHGLRHREAVAPSVGRVVGRFLSIDKAATREVATGRRRHRR